VSVIVATLDPSTPVEVLRNDGDTPYRVVGIIEHGKLDGSHVRIRMDAGEAGRLAGLLLNACGVKMGDAPGGADQTTAIIENMTRALTLIRNFAGEQDIPPDGRDAGWARTYVLCDMALQGKKVPIA
jgi:hypothetical protein